MNTPSRSKDFVAAVVLGLWVLVGVNTVPAISAEPSEYRVDFVSTTASGYAMNDQGLIAGVLATLPPGCTPSTCAPVYQAVVWSGDTVIPLPLLPGFSTVTAVNINAGGWVAGYAGDPYGTGARAVVWKPTVAGYTIIDLGVLPGTSSAWAVGIDDLGRAVGWSTTGTLPGTAAPFVWSESGGLADLATQGFPYDIPLAISPGGTVATVGYWYRLDDPGSVTALAPPPPHFSGPSGAAINDAGDQVRFQISTSTEFFPYLFRYNHAGTWQQIGFSPCGMLAPCGIGGINAAGDITATVGGTGLIAYGPDGLAEPLSTKLSPAYGGGATAEMTIVPTGGPITASEQILARVMIGRSPRLVRLKAAEACTTGCSRVASIQMVGKMIGRPRGQCTPRASDQVMATLTVTDEAGTALSGATLTGRFLDDYYLDEPVTGTTGRNGTLRITHKGPACVGAIAILVDDITTAGGVLDFQTGELTDFVIPQP